MPAGITPKPISIKMSADHDPVTLLVRALKEQEDHLKEVLEAVERRDMTQQQVKEYLRWVQKNVKELRRSSKFGVATK